jgi:Rod binding domain-containing protein
MSELGLSPTIGPAVQPDPLPLIQTRFRSLQNDTQKDPAALRRAAQDFESVLLNRLFQEMQNTIPKSGLFDDAAMEQTQGLFWQFLADHIAQNGGIGLAENLYQDFCRSVGLDPQTASGTTTALRGTKRIEATSGRTLSAPSGLTEPAPNQDPTPARKHIERFLELHSTDESHPTESKS